MIFNFRTKKLRRFSVKQQAEPKSDRSVLRASGVSAGSTTGLTFNLPCQLGIRRDYYNGQVFP